MLDGDKYSWYSDNHRGQQCSRSDMRKEMNFPIEEKLTKKSEINIVVTEVLNKNEC